MYTIEGSGFLVSLDDDRLEVLCDHYDTTINDVQNDIPLGDVELADNISSIDVIGDEGDEVDYDVGVWYIECAPGSGEYDEICSKVVEIMPDIEYPDDLFFDSISIELFQ